LANMAFLRTFMYDGRFESLEAQALGPLFDHEEMDMTDSMVVARLQADTVYVRLFRQAFGEPRVTLERVAKAFATYQRTLISSRSPYDRWRGGDATALSPAAQRGEILFRSTRLGCASCHVPPLFTDGNFHNTGLYEAGAEADSGRAQFTKRAQDLGRFKTSTLRNIMVTFPYMHDGRFNTIDEVLEHYSQGGKEHPVKDDRIRPLGLTPDERADLAAFLEALTDQDFMNTSQL
jgi:cytochrome c peroxidase